MKRWIGRFGCLFVLVCVCWVAIWLRDLSEWARLAACRPYYVHGVAEAYARKHEGEYPPLSGGLGEWSFDASDEIHATDSPDFYCESDPEHRMDYESRGVSTSPDQPAIRAWSYIYLGYIIENEAQAQEFLDVYEQSHGQNKPLPDVIDAPSGMGSGNTNQFVRLRTLDTLPLELDVIKANASKIPVVFEWPGHHRDPGGKVTYYDGHTEFVPYPGPFPMTESFINRLREIRDRRTPVDTR